MSPSQINHTPSDIYLKQHKEFLEYHLQQFIELSQADSGALLFYDIFGKTVEFQVEHNLKEDYVNNITRFISRDINSILNEGKTNLHYRWNDKNIICILFPNTHSVIPILALIDPDEAEPGDNYFSILKHSIMGLFLSNDYSERLNIFKTLIETEDTLLYYIEETGDIIDIYRFADYPGVNKSRELVGDNIDDRFKELKDDDLDRTLEEVFKEGEQYTIQGISHRNEEGLMEYRRLTIYPIKVDTDPVEKALVIDEDITELEEVKTELSRIESEWNVEHQKLERKLNESKMLYKIATIITSSLDIEEVSEKILKSLGKYFGISHAGILIVDEEDERTLNILADLEIDKKHRGRKIHIGPGSVTGMVAMTGEPRIIDDIDEEDDYLNIINETRSEIAVPLKIKGETIGVLNVESPELNAFGEDELELLTTLSSIISIALNNAKLFKMRSSDLKEMERLSRIKSDFISTISHEMRTPLTTIIGYLDILKEQIFDKLTEFQKRYIVSSIKETHKLSNMFDQILHISNLERSRIPVEKEWLSTERIISSVLEDVELRREEKDISINVEIEKDCQMVFTDEFSTYVIIKNLVDNAIKFNKEGGEIDIRINKIGDKAYIEVSDTGIGIKKEDQNRIFERFFQIEPDKMDKRSGIGLGLYIVKHLIEILNGRIKVSSRLRYGTTFTIELPQPQK